MKITFGDLEIQKPINFLFPDEDELTTLELSRYLDALRKSVVLRADIPLTYGRCKSVLIEIWHVVGSQAVVLTGPQEWLLDGKQWLCLTDRELMIALVPPMIQHWGKEPPKGAGYFDSLSKMTDAIPRQDELPSTSLETPALEAPCEFTDLELV